MFTYSDYLDLCRSFSCWECSCLIDYEECSVYCNNTGEKFCHMALSEIMLDYYNQSTGAVVPFGDFLERLGDL